MRFHEFALYYATPRTRSPLERLGVSYDSRVRLATQNAHY